jgi:hypothetical protein
MTNFLSPCILPIVAIMNSIGVGSLKSHGSWFSYKFLLSWIIPKKITIGILKNFEVPSLLVALSAYRHPSFASIVLPLPLLV